MRREQGLAGATQAAAMFRTSGSFHAQVAAAQPVRGAVWGVCSQRAGRVE